MSLLTDRLPFALALVALFCHVPANLVAQGTPSRDGVTGTILDAETAHPLADAVVILEPRPLGVLPTRPAGGSAFLGGSRSTRTDTAGQYHFPAVSGGSYQLHVRRLGYRSATVEVEPGGAASSRVSVGLVVEPVALEPVAVTAQPGAAGMVAYGRTAATSRHTEAERRLATERLRQRRYLQSDVRAVTHADVEEGITLAETDLFRGLQRLPGVSTRDDYASELWVRGAPWEQTRVSFDGLPLFNPTQALGVFSGVNPDALGSVLLYPGVQPASLGGGAAGALDLRSRRGGEEEGVQGFGELSLISGRLALDGASGDGRAAWMVAGRRTYLDWLTGTIGRAMDDPEVRLPYHFADLVGRVDYELDGGRSLEASAIGTRNRITDDLPDELQGNRVDWGNTAGRLTFAAPLWGGRVRHTVGVSQSVTEVREEEPDSALEERYNASHLPSFRVGVRQASLGGSWEADGSRRRSAGYELSATSVFGEVRGISSVDGELIEQRVAGSDRLLQLAGWAERRWQPTERITVDAGLRGEAGEPVRNGGALRLAPRITARYQPASDLSFSAGIARTFQYAQTPMGGGRTIEASLLNGHFWLVAGDSFPAVRADIAAVGAERWIGAHWLAAANAYLRRSSGVVVPDPTPGELVDRPLYVEGENRARGVELSLRKLAGRWTASVGYTLAASELEAEGLRFAAPTDRRHTLDATSTLRLGRAWRLGAAFTAASGEPYTRLFGPNECYSVDPGCVEYANERIEEPSANRNTPYQSLDLLAEWNRRFRGWEMGAYLQLRNALGRQNTGAYVNSYDPVCTSLCGTERAGYIQQPDEFVPGLPTLPVFGFRVSF